MNVASEGDSEDEALANLHEALALYFEDDDLQAVTSVSNAKVAELALQSA